MADPTYTTVERVSGSLLLASRTYTEAHISGAILRAEGVIDAVMRRSGIGSEDYTFNEQKHGLIADTTIALASMWLLLSDVEEFASSSSSTQTADMLWAIADRNLAILSDPRVMKYLEAR